MMPSQSEPYIRASAAIIEDGKILLVRRLTDKFLCLPGGRVEFGETLKDALEREIREETNQEIKVGSLIYLRDFIPSGKRHVLEAVFSCRRVGRRREVTNEFDPCKKFEDYSLEWVALKDLPKRRFFPAFMKKDLVRALSKGENGIYVGKRR